MALLAHAPCSLPSEQTIVALGSSMIRSIDVSNVQVDIAYPSYQSLKEARGVHGVPTVIYMSRPAPEYDADCPSSRGDGPADTGWTE